MEEIIKQIMNDCALRYAKGFRRWMHLWDDQLTLPQKATEIARELELQGYLIIKQEDLRPLVDDNGE